jgi:hypothetical protein
MEETQRAAEVQKIFAALNGLMTDAAEREQLDWTANHGYASSLASIVSKFKSSPVTSQTVNELNFELDVLSREYIDVVERATISDGDATSSYSLKEGIRALQDHLSYLDQENIIFHVPDPETVLPPQQAIAPFQFKVTETQVSLIEQTNHPKDGSSEIAQAALRVLLRVADDIREDLANSNHPQVLRAFIPLQESLVEERGVIETGINATMFDAQVNARSDEISSGLHASLAEFARSTLNYCAQFQDWQLYVDNVTETRLSEEDSQRFTNIAKGMAESLASQPAVDPRVIEALRTAGEWGETIKTPQGRVGVAKTVLNVVAGCFNFVVRAPLKEIASSVVKEAIIIGLTYAITNWGLMFNVPDGSWLFQAADFIREMLKALK